MSPIPVTVAFDKPVTGFTANRLTVANGTAVLSADAGDQRHYTVAITPVPNTTMTVYLAGGLVLDAAGNGNAASAILSRTHDDTPPVVTIDQSPFQSDPTSASTILYDVHFSEPVTGFGVADVVLGGTGGASTVAVSGGPTDYAVLVSGMTGDGTVVATIAAGGAQDAAGNLSAASTSTHNQVTYSTAGSPPPVVTLTAGGITYVEHAPWLPVDAAATVVTGGSLAFTNGRLVAQVVDGDTGDRLGILHQGFAAGEVGVINDAVDYGGIQVGRMEGGTGGTPLTVTWTAQASIQAIQAVLRRVAYRHADSEPVGSGRRVQMTVSDNLGATSLPESRAVAITPVDDPPVAATGLRLAAVAGIPVAGTLTGTDPEGAAVTFALAAPAAQGQVVVDAVSGRFVYTPSEAARGSDAFRFTVSDGVGTSALALVAIDVTETGDDRLAITSDPPVAVVAGDAMNHAVTVDIGGLTDASGLDYAFADVVPAGMQLVRAVDGSSAQLRWTAVATAGGYVRFTILVTDAATRCAAAQTVVLKVVAAPMEDG